MEEKKLVLTDGKGEKAAIYRREQRLTRAPKLSTGWTHPPPRPPRASSLGAHSAIATGTCHTKFDIPMRQATRVPDSLPYFLSHLSSHPSRCSSRILEALHNLLLFPSRSTTGSASKESVPPPKFISELPLSLHPHPHQPRLSHYQQSSPLLAPSHTLKQRTVTNSELCLIHLSHI